MSVCVWTGYECVTVRGQSTSVCKCVDRIRICVSVWDRVRVCVSVRTEYEYV